jgi:hypothetical protein
MLCADAQAHIFLESLAIHSALCIPCTGSVGSLAPGGRELPCTGNGLARQAEAAQSCAAAMQEHGPRHHSRMGGRLDTAGREPDGRVADVSSRSAAPE